MANQLHTLWDNYTLYTFLEGEAYIRKRELEICACIPNYQQERDIFIEVNRCDWILNEYTK